MSATTAGQSTGAATARSTPAKAAAGSESAAEPTAAQGPGLGKEFVARYQVGMIVTARGGPCKAIMGTTPVPLDWPEQHVTILEEDTSPTVGRTAFRLVEGTVQQMVVEIPNLAGGEVAHALVTMQITRNTLTPPTDTSGLVVPKKLSRDLRIYLGPSPLIESRNPKIRTLAKEIIAGKESAWSQVEAIYDWVRTNVEYKNGPIKGAMAALKDKTGDCEELTSLFIALCRASDIPARTVWVPGHCYPEFYLEDAAGQGHWFPCQAAGAREFGGISETRPILQKGDNFRNPQKPRERQRYLAEYLTGGGGEPKVKFVRKLIDPLPIDAQQAEADAQEAEAGPPGSNAPVGAPLVPAPGSAPNSP